MCRLIVRIGQALVGLASVLPMAPASAQSTAASVQAPPETPFRQIFGFRTPLRDGVRLSSDVWLPKPDGRYRVVLIRTPYLKGLGFLEPQAQYFARRGYAVVVQDTRGRGDSEGEFTPFFQEVADGYDAVEHIAKQPWSNGRICMLGGSYMGSVQWLAAKARPPHLTCLASTSPGGRFANELPYVGGAFAMQFAIQWLNMTAGRESQGNTKSIDWAAVFQHRPLRTMDEALGRKMPVYREWLGHPTVDDYWRRAYLAPDDFKQMQLDVELHFLIQRGILRAPMSESRHQSDRGAHTHQRSRRNHCSSSHRRRDLSPAPSS